ncbi:DUF2062 domain-containing protein [Idiomarina xiamenensis]|uniref:DUF2062 domain-containing protein n=1 Tax=Idiomarina xiamenensis 10-D-4 TaxID=740709 RepID=K2JHV6_9GAMM|nr:DUF2062 domain-containing protein [Idiomarina xiamenensis]EKE82961.1 hypothetical protein A10D4_08979 [Idiomarina xiamenensis 10-D-4]
MARKFIQKLMPNHQKIKDNKNLRFFGRLTQDANLWHLNRRSASGAFAVGLFCAFIPIPFQMVLAAALAILFRVNMPLSIALVWVSNPITMPPLFYLCYVIGTLVLGKPAQHFAFSPTWQWLVESIGSIGPAFLIGCLVMAISCSLLGYIAIRLLWRWSVVRSWRRRPQSASNDLMEP